MIRPPTKQQIASLTKLAVSSVQLERVHERYRALGAAVSGLITAARDEPADAQRVREATSAIVVGEFCSGAK